MRAICFFLDASGVSSSIMLNKSSACCRIVMDDIRLCVYDIFLMSGLDNQVFFGACSIATRPKFEKRHTAPAETPRSCPGSPTRFIRRGYYNQRVCCEKHPLGIQLENWHKTLFIESLCQQKGGDLVLGLQNIQKILFNKIKLLQMMYLLVGVSARFLVFCELRVSPNQLYSNKAFFSTSNQPCFFFAPFSQNNGFCWKMKVSPIKKSITAQSN